MGRWPLAFMLFGLFTGCGTIPTAPNSSPVEQAALVTAADETAAMVRLRAIADAQALYQMESATGEYATLEELTTRQLVRDPSAGKLARYRFEVNLRPRGFEATAVPEKYGITGKRSFYIDETRTMRGADKRGAKAGSSDPAL